ncbi:TPA: McrC family protein [Acinetobacter nosocomialis]|uniref:McrC family protein n=1 Tax=Acinetobacter calcoaceticus/baumannii complex TaxID=909768 RepID=UPI0002AEC8BC|nr:MULTISPECIES: McrC family protein [Acinetobacter calcoaceticus/baumannii complex]ELW84374.1 McrBC 5-methylcytosine restriction system component [Acinetobacter sp. OIFC021]EXE51427.1 mcrBC 5-methylcytosine restriction system component family protein [Acinetobacter sp. 766875]MDE1666834.1 McrC family protein [Acinetobacter nosocomialis]MDE9415447.1 McrC family protein [Acinetobacter nosocomialis]HAI56031.1 restriction endonuclease [Acinetobacter nosocomialis]
MSDLITVREYAYISIARTGCPESTIDHAYISASAFDHLCELSASFSKHGAKVFELAGRRKLRLDQYVGVIETKCGTRIEILPKHVDINLNESNETAIEKERELLKKMLKVSLHLPYRDAGEANLSRFKQPIHEWIIDQFLCNFEKLIQRGLRFDYQRVQEEQKYLRGQLHHVKHMRQSPARKHIFPIEHDIYEVDRPENRLIKTALEVVCKKTRSSTNWKLAQELRLMTGEIPKSRNIVQDFKQWQSGRLLALYAEIKPWTELILSEYMPVSTHGGWRGMSLLFPMEKLFEHYVAYHLCRELNDWEVKTQLSSQHICLYESRPIFRLKPDIQIQHKKTRKKIILDTKWKLLDQNNQTRRFGLKDSDIQQMFAYSYYYLDHASEVILVYPRQERKFSEELSFSFNLKDTPASLRVIPFDLDKGYQWNKLFSILT